jgi:hypothetical protein
VIEEYFAKNVHEVEIINFGLKNGRAEGIIEGLDGSSKANHSLRSL